MKMGWGVMYTEGEQSSPLTMMDKFAVCSRVSNDDAYGWYGRTGDIAGFRSLCLALYATLVGGNGGISDDLVWYDWYCGRCVFRQHPDTKTGIIRTA